MVMVLCLIVGSQVKRQSLRMVASAELGFRDQWYLYPGNLK
jgi:hypothetical protein